MNSTERKSILNQPDHLDWIETFFCIMLNRSHKVLGFYKIAIGGVSSLLIDPKIVFQVALLSNASKIILTHNHPGGEIIPSKNDILLTNNMIMAGLYLDIDILDHIIITS